jgi:hypothetical protein
MHLAAMLVVRGWPDPPDLIDGQCSAYSPIHTPACVHRVSPRRSYLTSIGQIN